MSFSEVFPCDFDLTVVNDGRLFLADDLYCLQPACDCDEVVVSFIDVAKGGPELGHIRASVADMRKAEIVGGVQPLWSELYRDRGRKCFRDRYRRMREVARSMPSAPAVVNAPKIGRNAPCPCGSGKKSKRCCTK